MHAIVFYLGALGLFGLSALLTRKTSYYTRSGGSKYENKKKRQLIGTVLMVAGVLLFALALVTQVFSGNTPAIESPPVSTGASQPQIAPVIQTPSQTIQISSNSLTIHAFPTSGGADQPQAEPVDLRLNQAFQLVKQKQLDAALDKVNAVIRSAPQNPTAYGLRGGIYAEKKLWFHAEKDYQTALQLDGSNVQMQFNLAEIEFLQKKYDAARPGFAALEQQPDMGDLAAYKVFQCDLFGGHEHTAAQELDAFNQVGSNASYYFANASWSLYHHQTEDARGWLTSAANIYAPDKFGLYAASLIDLGYMPLPPPPQH